MTITDGNRKKGGEPKTGSAHRFINRKSIAAVLVVFSLILSVSAATGDLLVTGEFTIHLKYKPSIDIKNNTTYPKTTFEWTTSVVNNTTVGTLRVHVNFDQIGTDNAWLLNVLSVYYNGSDMSNFTVHVSKWVKIGPYVLYEPFTSFITIYIKNATQTIADPGTELQNNTTTGPFPLYPGPQEQYHIGMNYSRPTGIPDYIQQDLNSFGEYITFTLKFV